MKYTNNTEEINLVCWTQKKSHKQGINRADSETGDVYKNSATVLHSKKGQ